MDIKVRLYNFNESKIDYLLLTEDQISLMNYLIKNDYLECDFEILDKKKFKKIGEKNEQINRN